MKPLYKTTFLVVGILALTLVPSFAPQLRLSDGTVTLVIDDNGPGDSEPALGSVGFSGVFGVNDQWEVEVSASTMPVLGTPTTPILDVGADNLSYEDNSVLTVEFTETNFFPITSGTASASIGGFTDGTVSYRTYASTSNTNFGTNLLLTSTSPVPDPFGSFSGSVFN